jgi:MFS family permease
MSKQRLAATVSAMSPGIVIAALIFASLADWLQAPDWALFILCAIILCLAVLVWSRRGLDKQLRSIEQLGFERRRQWLVYELSGRGLPVAYFALAPVFFIAGVVSFDRFPGFLVFVASMLLVAAWGKDRRRYPAD